MTVPVTLPPTNTANTTITDIDDGKNSLEELNKNFVVDPHVKFYLLITLENKKRKQICIFDHLLN